MGGELESSVLDMQALGDLSDLHMQLSGGQLCMCLALGRDLGWGDISEYGQLSSVCFLNLKKFFILQFTFNISY